MNDMRVTKSVWDWGNAHRQVTGSEVGVMMECADKTGKVHLESVFERSQMQSQGVLLLFLRD